MTKVQRCLSPLKGWLCLLSLMVFISCGSKADPATYFSHYHPANWKSQHGGPATNDLTSCTKCHEVSLLRTGNSVPGCLTTGCHHQTEPSWAVAGTHGLRAKKPVGDPAGSFAACQICHGKDFSGGASAKACATCHGVAAPHPAKPWSSWGGSPWTHTTTDPSNAAVCAQCHYPGSPDNPPNHPATPAPGGTAPGCFNNTMCHGSASAPHPVPFLLGLTDSLGNGHVTATASVFTSDCAKCHAHSGTSPVSGAPLCVSCHKLADPTAPTTGTGTCLSCHVGASGLAGGPTGTTFPNIAGAHAKHLGLKTTLTCDSCHAGSGAGSDRHYANAKSATSGPASVSIAAAFNAQNGGSATFSSSAMTCGAVSCHGGQTTPNWRAGSIASDTQCRVCHTINDGTGVAQFNDALGRHTWGTHKTAGTADCTICHDMSTSNAALGAVNHFAELDTTAVGSTNKLPSGTIVFKNTATYPISGNTTYSVSAPRSEGDGGCALACHGVIHDPAVNHWAAPKGSGVAHPMPFYTTGTSTAGNHHQTVTQAQFTSDCATCHDLSGPSTKSGPACSVCHTLASPVGAGAGAGTCLSCHVGASFTTLGPGGTAWPSLKGSHAKHLSLPTFTRPSPGLPAELASSPYPACAACHQGSVPGDSAQTHYANANKRATTPVTGGPGSVAIASTFNAKSGPASITSSASAFTCSNVSCHGGQTTPGWQTGTLTVNATTYCTACHVARSTATQYNDATGRHVNPSNHRQTCDYCHDMTQAKSGAQNHFKYLDTPAVSGVGGTPADQYPSDTIKFGGGAQPATGALTYTVTPSTQGRGSCALSCHGKTHSNLTWN